MYLYGGTQIVPSVSTEDELNVISVPQWASSRSLLSLLHSERVEELLPPPRGADDAPPHPSRRFSFSPCLSIRRSSSSIDEPSPTQEQKIPSKEEQRVVTSVSTEGELKVPSVSTVGEQCSFSPKQKVVLQQQKVLLLDPSFGSRKSSFPLRLSIRKISSFKDEQKVPSPHRS